MTYARPIVAVIVVLVLSVFADGSRAQNSPSQHQHAAPNLIDGAVHPELIPDSTAYRLYFITVAENPTPLPHEAQRQHAHLSRAGLNEADIQAASKVLANFKLAYAALIDEYNNSPEVRNNTNDGITLFLSKRDALVQETRTMLNGALTPQGMANFHANIQQEKANMKIAASEVARGQQ